MLAALADHSKLPPYMILNHNTMPKEQLPRGIIFRCQPESWMMNEITKDRLSVVWNEGARSARKKIEDADHR
jgi:hypothetical protein